MIRIKFEITADTPKGEYNLGTYEYKAEVDGKKLVIEQRINEILVKDKSIGQYFLSGLKIETIGKDMDI